MSKLAQHHQKEKFLSAKDVPQQKYTSLENTFLDL